MPINNKMNFGPNKNDRIKDRLGNYWKELQANSLHIKDLFEKYPDVCKYHNINEDNIETINDLYYIKINPYYASIIDWNNYEDPLLKIVFPDFKEIEDYEGVADSSGEKYNTKTQGLQHKYEPTALIKATDLCFSYCRYCFRRRHVGKKRGESLNSFNEILEYIKKHKEVDNVLVTGGDPLMLSNDKIYEMLYSLRRIEHIKTIRFGTKSPAYNPYRSADKDFINILKEFNWMERGKPIFIISHFDHINELTETAINGIQNYIRNGIRVHNQNVMLRGVSKSNFLTLLYKKLQEVGVTPYYSFQARPVLGTQHYIMSLKESIETFAESFRKLNGLSKTVKLTMSTMTGKIELVTYTKVKRNKLMYTFKYISSKYPDLVQKPFHFVVKDKYVDNIKWIDDFFKIRHKFIGDENIYKKLKFNLLK